MQVYDICPLPKPRQTQRDRWAKRPAVMRYRAFCDEVRLKRLQLPVSGSHVTFVLPMPESWSNAKRAASNGQPHQQKPDVDNLMKALMDALFDDDCTVWDVRVSKIWGEAGSIRIAEIAAPETIATEVPQCQSSPSCKKKSAVSSARTPKKTGTRPAGRISPATSAGSRQILLKSTYRR